MHKFLRAVGFSNCKRRHEMMELLKKAESEAKLVRIVHDENGDVRAQKQLSLGRRIGLSLCGTMDEYDRFEPEFFFPYHQGNCITSQAACQIQRHAEKAAFSGICDEHGLGVSLIFYLQNQLDYLERELNRNKYCHISSVLMSGLSVEGKVLLPTYHDTEKKLSLLQCEDLYTIVESCFMPYGVECDQYSIIGEITEVEEVENVITGEMIYSLTVKCNGLNFQVCINQKDLIGLPAPGRRFKGSVWMQGYAAFQED
ncbi:MAG: DUF3881 family protein [Lachnospiraceae bacterium]|nr:DUF3881 family protein [Lachnospiraceae bacterium]